MISEWAGGVQPASPTPTPMRARISCQKFWAKPHSTVKALQAATEVPMMNGRFLRSARRAIGMPSTV